MEKRGICLNGPERGIFDLTHAKAEMMKFMDRFDQQDPAIALRRTHTLRVVEEARFLGSRLHMSKSEIEVAELIALLHDYGRFLPEAEEYGSWQPCGRTPVSQRRDQKIYGGKHI